MVTFGSLRIFSCIALTSISLELLPTLIGGQKAQASQIVPQDISLAINVTYDAHGAVYIGNEDASQFQFIGRDTTDIGSFPPPENCPPLVFFAWECVDNFFVESVDPAYIYSRVVDDTLQFFTNLYFPAWSDFSVENMIIAEVLTNSGSIVTEAESGRWTQTTTSINSPGDLGDVPLDEELILAIQQANASNSWTNVISLGQNDGTTIPWNLISPITGIPVDAHFLGFFDPNSTEIVRLEFPVPSKTIPKVSEPRSIFGIILVPLLLGLFCRRKSQS